MSSEQMQSEIAQLNNQIDECDDPRLGYRMVQDRISAYKQAGRAVPVELSRLEKQMAAECLAESQGR